MARDNVMKFNIQQHLAILEQGPSDCGGCSSTVYRSAKANEPGAIHTKNGIWPARPTRSRASHNDDVWTDEEFARFGPPPVVEYKLLGELMTQH